MHSILPYFKLFIFGEKKYVAPNFKLEISTKSDRIDCNDAQLIKWQIIKPKISIKKYLFLFYLQCLDSNMVV